MPDIIQSLWVGDRLSVMERLCIASFLYHGHPFHLYAYQPLEGVPGGTVLMDASEILPESSIFQYTEHASYAGFANFFRYKLLLERGAWWVDTDVICLRPFDFASPYVFSSEGEGDQWHIGCQVIKVPPRSAVMRLAWDACKRSNPKELKWGQTGPILMANAIGVCLLQQYVQPANVFAPVHWSEWSKILDSQVTWDFGERTYAIHLWNEMWRRDNRSKLERYDPGCLYETLKQRYLPSC